MIKNAMKNCNRFKRILKQKKDLQQSFNLLTDMRTIACVTLYIGCYFIHVIMFLLVVVFYMYRFIVTSYV